MRQGGSKNTDVIGIFLPPGNGRSTGLRACVAEEERECKEITTLEQRAESA